MTKFEAIFAGKKIQFEAIDLYRAKLKAIELLKVAKSKQGLISIYSLQSHYNEDFKYL